MKKRGLESICQSVGPAERVVISTARAVQMIDDLLKAQEEHDRIIAEIISILEDADIADIMEYAVKEAEAGPAGVDDILRGIRSRLLQGESYYDIIIRAKEGET